MTDPTRAEAEHDVQKPDPVAMLRELHDSGQGLDSTTAEAYLTQVYEDREGSGEAEDNAG
jgi:hypothetical protein